MKGAAEGLRIAICGSNLFSIKGMRGVRKCHLFWSWEQEFEVFFFFFLSFSFPLPFVCFSENFVDVPALSFLLWAAVCEAAGPALITRDFKGCCVLGRCLPWFSVAIGFCVLQKTASFDMSSAFKGNERFHMEFFLKSFWRYPEPCLLGFYGIQEFSFAVAQFCNCNALGIPTLEQWQIFSPGIIFF